MLQQLKTEIINAVKSGDSIKRDILKVLVGDIETIESREGKPLSEDKVEGMIRKLIEANEETLKLTKDTHVYERLFEECQILQDFLPTVLSVDEIQEYLDVDMICSAKSDGQAMGLAMSSLKKNGHKVLGEDVKTVVEKMRNE